MNIKEFLQVNRLKQVELANYLGITEASVSRMCKGISKPSQENLRKIVTNTKGWDTSMLSDEPNQVPAIRRSSTELNQHLCKVLPTAARGGSLSDFSEAITSKDIEYAISPIAGADWIIPVTGESMAPEYPNGSRVVVKKVNDKAFLEWGKVYVLDTVNGAVIKELHKAQSDDEVECVSLNPDPKFASFNVRRSDILGVYRVLMCMALK